MANIEHDNTIERPEDYEQVLIQMASMLSLEDISYILCEYMKNNDLHDIESKAYDSKTGKDLVYFKMNAKFNYYLEDFIPDEEEEEDG